MPVYTVFVAEKIYLSVTFNDRFGCWIYTESGMKELMNIYIYIYIYTELGMTHRYNETDMSWT